MKLVRIALALVLALAVATVATGCTDKDTAAKVNGEKIKMSELNAQLDQLKKQYPQMFSGADGEARLLDFKRRLLDNLINQKLITQAAKEKGIDVTDSDVQKQIDQLKQGFKSDAEFETALKNAGMTKEALEKQIRDQLLSQKLVEAISADAKISDKDIEAYYKKNKKQFYQAASKRASHILFDAKDKAKAQKVLDQLEGGDDFASLAKENSKDPGSAAKGGDLGWPTTPYVPEFESALKKLDKGEMSGLVKSQFGWHIIKVTDERGAKQLSLAEAKKQIEQIMQQQQRADAYQKFLDEIRKKAKIEIVAKELKADAAPAGAPTQAAQPAQQGK
ncbi:MAG: peptidylprolyl isomerase [Coriobacteriales bacterium]|nr:peptidylprolyl isomerase [Coriobacteriales bacterium]